MNCPQIQLTINFNDQKALDSLSQYGTIDWKSDVLNILFLTPYYNVSTVDIEKLDGIKITWASRQRKINNKKYV